MPGDAGIYRGILQQDKAVNNHWLVFHSEKLVLFDINYRLEDTAQENVSPYVAVLHQTI